MNHQNIEQSGNLEPAIVNGNDYQTPAPNASPESSDFIRSLVTLDEELPWETLGYERRSYQPEAVAEIKKGMLVGHQKGQLIIGTGGGKTSIAMHLMTQTYGRALYIGPSLESVHRGQTELEKFREAGFSKTSQRLNGAAFDPTAEITFSTLQMLTNANPPFKGIPRDHFDLIILDEAHRGMGPKVRQVCQYFGGYQIHMTATPENTAHSLDEIAPHRFYECSYDELVDKHGFPTPIYMPSPIEGDRLEEAEILTDDYSFEDGSEYEILNMPARFQAVLQILEEHVMPKGDQAIVFWPSVASSKEFTDKVAGNRSVLRDSVVHVDGKTKKTERNKTLEGFRKGQPGAISNAVLFEESLDAPNIVHVILATPTVSIRKIMQQIGRGSRKGKPVFYVWDLCSAVTNLERVQPKKMPLDVCATFGLERKAKGAVLAGQHKGEILSYESEGSERKVVYARTTRFNSEAIPFYGRHLNLDFMGDREVAIQIFRIFADIFDTDLVNLAYSPTHFLEREERITLEPANSEEEPFTITFADAYTAARMFASLGAIQENAFREDVGAVCKRTNARAQAAVAPALGKASTVTTTNQPVIERPPIEYLGPTDLPKDPFDLSRIPYLVTLNPAERKIWHYIFSKIAGLPSTAKTVKISQEERLDIVSPSEAPSTYHFFGNPTEAAAANHIIARSTSSNEMEIDIVATRLQWGQVPRPTPNMRPKTTCFHIFKGLPNKPTYSLILRPNAAQLMLGEDKSTAFYVGSKEYPSLVLPPSLGGKLCEALERNEDFLVLENDENPHDVLKLIRYLQRDETVCIHAFRTESGGWRIPIGHLPVLVENRPNTRYSGERMSRGNLAKVNAHLNTFTPTEESARIAWENLKTFFQPCHGSKITFRSSITCKTSRKQWQIIGRRLPKGVPLEKALASLDAELRKHQLSLSCTNPGERGTPELVLECGEFLGIPAEPTLCLPRVIPSVRNHMLNKPIDFNDHFPNPIQGAGEVCDILWARLKEQFKFGNYAALTISEVEQLLKKHHLNKTAHETVEDVLSILVSSNVNIDVSFEPTDKTFTFSLRTPPELSYEGKEKNRLLLRRLRKITFGPDFPHEWQNLWDIVIDQFELEHKDDQSYEDEKFEIAGLGYAQTHPQLLTEFAEQIPEILSPLGVSFMIENKAGTLIISELSVEIAPDITQPVYPAPGAALCARCEGRKTHYQMAGAYQRQIVATPPSQDLLAKIYTAVEAGQEFLEIPFDAQNPPDIIGTDLLVARKFFEAYGYSGNLLAVALPLSRTSCRVSLRGISTTTETAKIERGPKKAPTFNGKIPSSPFDEVRLPHLVVFNPVQRQVWAYIFNKYNQLTKPFPLQLTITAEELKEALGNTPEVDYAIATLTRSARLNNIQIKQANPLSFNIPINQNWQIKSARNQDSSRAWRKQRESEVAVINTNRGGFIQAPINIDHATGSTIYSPVQLGTIRTNIRNETQYLVEKIETAQKRGEAYVIFTPQDFSSASKSQANSRLHALEFLEAILPQSLPLAPFLYIVELPDGSLQVPIHNLVINPESPQLWESEIDKREAQRKTLTLMSITFGHPVLDEIWQKQIIPSVMQHPNPRVSPTACTECQTPERVDLTWETAHPLEVMQEMLHTMGVKFTYYQRPRGSDHYAVDLDWDDILNPQGQPTFPKKAHLRETVGEYGSTYDIEGVPQRYPLSQSPSPSMLRIIFETIKAGDDVIRFTSALGRKDIDLIHSQLTTIREMFWAYGVRGPILPVLMPLEPDSILVSLRGIPIVTHAEATAKKPLDVDLGPLTGTMRARMREAGKAMLAETP